MAFQATWLHGGHQAVMGARADASSGCAQDALPLDSSHVSSAGVSEVTRLTPSGAPIFSLAVDGAAPGSNPAAPDSRQQVSQLRRSHLGLSHGCARAATRLRYGFSVSLQIVLASSGLGHLTQDVMLLGSPDSAAGA